LVKSKKVDKGDCREKGTLKGGEANGGDQVHCFPEMVIIGMVQR